jgi:predicted membrane channel-forming protein YqfA (hemolysin III family)
MPVPRSGVLWRRIFVVLLIAVAASYVWYASREYPHGGSAMGLTYGITGTLLILLLASFGIRKRWYRSTFGTLEQWMQSHIYLGILVLVILLCHTGGRFNDAIAVTTLVLVGIVVFSGVAGAILYVTIPRLLTEVESNLTVEELSDQLNQLARSMARVASGKSAPFQRIYSELIRESQPGWLAGWRLLFARHRQRKLQATGDWSNLLGLVAKDEQEDLRQLLVISRQRKELLLRLLYQQRYKNVLESWLYLHVPFTIALLVFAVAHVVAVFYYRKIG